MNEVRKPLQIKLSASEREQIERTALSLGLSMAAYIRLCVLKDIKNQQREQ